MRVLVLDGSTSTTENHHLPRELSTRRIRVDNATTLNEGLALTARKRFAAIVIERREQPAELVRRFRAESGTPIVVLRDVKDSDEAIRCLNNGADDVLADPVNIDELVARLRSLTRRCLPGSRELMRVDDLELNCETQEVTRAGRPLKLSEREFELLEYMVTHHDRVIGLDELSDQLSGIDADFTSSDAIDLLEGLRTKLEAIAKKPLIHRVDVGRYMLSDMPPLISDGE